jgi:hypothetical protein
MEHEENVVSTIMETKNDWAKHKRWKNTHTDAKHIS